MNCLRRLVGPWNKKSKHFWFVFIASKNRKKLKLSVHLNQESSFYKQTLVYIFSVEEEMMMQKFYALMSAHRENKKVSINNVFFF